MPPESDNIRVAKPEDKRQWGGGAVSRYTSVSVYQCIGIPVYRYTSVSVFQ